MKPCGKWLCWLDRVAVGRHTTPAGEFKTIERARRFCLKRKIIVTQSEILRAVVALSTGCLTKKLLSSCRAPVK
jgi:hypothetical protein